MNSSLRGESSVAHLGSDDDTAEVGMAVKVRGAPQRKKKVPGARVPSCPDDQHVRGVRDRAGCASDVLQRGCSSTTRQSMGSLLTTVVGFIC